MHTLISVFDDYPSALRAVHQLVDAGLPRHDLHIERGDQADLFSVDTQAWRKEHGTDHERGVLSSIGHFFVSLFGLDTPDDDARAYMEAVRRGSSVVVADVVDESQLERAARLLQELGAIDGGGVRMVRRESGRPVRELTSASEEDGGDTRRSWSRPGMIRPFPERAFAADESSGTRRPLGETGSNADLEPGDGKDKPSRGNR